MQVVNEKKNEMKKTCSAYMSNLKDIVAQEVQMVMDIQLRKLRKEMDSVAYTMSLRGKRQRAFLLYLCFNALAEKTSADLKYIATFIEYMQTASLVHDDIMDSSDKRRGAEAVHKKFGIPVAIMTGDYLIFEAWSILSNVKHEQAIRINRLFADMFCKMCLGQKKEEQLIKNINVSEEVYTEVIYNKTAAFFECICEVSAVLANADDRTVQLFGEFGKNLGMAYQIRDDMLIFLDEGNEKTLLSDLERRLVTLPIISTYKRMPKDDRVYFERVFIGELDVACSRIVELVKQSGTIDEIRKECNRYLDKAMECLGLLEQQAEIEPLYVYAQTFGL